MKFSLNDDIMQDVYTLTEGRLEIYEDSLTPYEVDSNLLVQRWLECHPRYMPYDSAEADEVLTDGYNKDDDEEYECVVRII